MKTPAAILRILDANANRASEALRVIEESMRFAENDSFLSGRFKATRHRLNTIVAAAKRELPIEMARDTLGDVGTNLRVTNEAIRGSISDVVRASCARLKEALRCLEEYTKLLDKELAGSFEQMRYDVYTLERAIYSAERANDLLAEARLYAILDGCGNESEFNTLVKSLSDVVDVIQLRDEKLNDMELCSRAKQMTQMCRGRCLTIINDRPDIAIAAQADGVHVGQDDLPAAVVRGICGPEVIVGVSTHSIQEARAAVLDGATYIGVGPVFSSQTKDFERVEGVSLVARVAEEIDLPAFAIGGITADNVDQITQAGMRRVAISHFLTHHSDPASAATKVRKRLQ